MNRRLKILLTNDDGFDAPGLEALFNSVTESLARHRPDESYEIVAVAPDRCRSECSHSLETSRLLSIRTIRNNWHCIDGTPVDCIRVALFAMGFRPDVVFSGINAGANLGVNLMVSGTFAAAREASVWGIPSMATSHYRHPQVKPTWEHTPEWLNETIGEFLSTVLDKGKPTNSDPPPLWNVNLPAVDPDTKTIPPRSYCEVDRCPIDRNGKITGDGQVRFEMDFHGRARELGRDVDLCFGGQITISKLGAYLPGENQVAG